MKRKVRQDYEKSRKPMKRKVPRDDERRCWACDIQIQSGELCSNCGEYNDPFFTSKYGDGARHEPQ